MKKDELVIMLIEAKAQKEYWREKYNNTFFNTTAGAAFEYWKAKVEALEEELDYII